jgi:hypothetical protein
MSYAQARARLRAVLETAAAGGAVTGSVITTVFDR